MQTVTMPIRRERISAGASVSIRVDCMLLKPAVPSPPMIDQNTMIAVRLCAMVIANAPAA